MRSDGDSFMSIIYHCPCHTCRMKVVCTRCRRNVFDVPFRFGEMVRHVTSAATRVCRFRDTIQDDFFRSHSGRKYSQHIAVVRKQKVFAQSEYLTDGKLNTIMPRVRSMIRPTQRLQQVWRCFFIQSTPQCHQMIPLFQGFYICSFYIIFLFHE